MSLDPDQRKILTSMFTDIWNTYRNNLPFGDGGEFKHYPKSNDSKHFPIFFEFYDTDQPASKLAAELSHQRKQERKKHKKKDKKRHNHKKRH